MMKNIISIALMGGILLLANLLSNRFFFRLDLTENKAFTLSRATRDVLRDLDSPVTITAYFSNNLPVQDAKTREDLQNMLTEYTRASKGMVNFRFESPESDEEKQKTMQLGILPAVRPIREKDQLIQKQMFLGAVIAMGEQEDVIPIITPESPMEYLLTTSIKKLSVADKPAIAFVQGHGEPGLNELNMVVQSLSILYSVETTTLEAAIPDRFRTVALVAPKDTIPPAELAVLDQFLARGGRLLLALNAVDGDLNTASGTVLHTGMEGWLAQKGIELENSFLIDAQCGSVTIQQQQGFFTINTPVSFPYLPLISHFTDHPVTKGLEQVLMAFASPVRYTGSNSGVQFTPIAWTSTSSAIIRPPLYFDVQKQWSKADFPLSDLCVGATVEGTFGGETPTRMVVFGDGDFPLLGQGRSQTPDNVSLLVNAIDWLSDDTGLIELRTKEVAARPIDPEFLQDDAEGKRQFLKYLNFGLPLLLVILYGVFRYQAAQRKRLRRMQERLH